MLTLKIENIHYAIAGEPILQNISLEVLHRKKLAIIGESGSGKSTLLKIIGGHLQATAGVIFLGSERILGPDNQLLPGHKQIAYLSQQYELLNNYKVGDLLEYNSKFSAEEDAFIVKLCKIDTLLKRKTHQLSGGEKQRVAIAKILLSKPSVLLLDEPYSNLDAHHKQIMKEVIANIGNHLQVSIIMASHEPTDILNWANEIAVIYNKTIVQQATPQQLYYKPANTYIAGLLGLYNLLSIQQLQQLYFTVNSSATLFLLRPEHIEIKPPTLNGLKGVVNGFSFMGHYWLAHITVNNIALKAIVLQPNFNIGTEVGIVFLAEYIVPIQ
jgi:ABC-type sugar transport system ATPase subunit